MDARAPWISNPVETRLSAKASAHTSRVAQLRGSSLAYPWPGLGGRRSFSLEHPHFLQKRLLGPRRSRAACRPGHVVRKLGKLGQYSIAFEGLLAASPCFYSRPLRRCGGSASTRVLVGPVDAFDDHLVLPGKNTEHGRSCAIAALPFFVVAAIDFDDVIFANVYRWSSCSRFSGLETCCRKVSRSNDLVPQPPG